MIKAKMHSDNGRQMILLGLSRENTTRLHEGKPIHIFAEEMDLPFDIVIIADETEQAIVDKLKQRFELPPESQWQPNRDN